MNRRTFLKRTALAVAAAQIPISLRLLANEPDKQKAKFIVMTPPRYHVEYRIEYGAYLVMAEILYGTGDVSPIPMDQHWQANELVFKEDINEAKLRCVNLLRDHLLREYSAYTPIKIDWPIPSSTIKMRGLVLGCTIT